MNKLSLAYSPCPNDTFIFHAMVSGLVTTHGISFNTHIGDVEELNRAAFENKYQITKLSFHTLLLLEPRYRLLQSGAALGHGCGPLLVAKKPLNDIAGAVIAVPGLYTTAWLLLKLWAPSINTPVVTRFDNILEGVSSGDFDAGLIIHEGRFVYPRYRLTRVVDLGEWWESETGLPIPLGCIALRQEEWTETAAALLSGIIRSSVEYAFEHPEASKEYVRRHASEMADEVISQHIQLYVNRYTLDMGDTGVKAVALLKEKARWAGIIP